MGRRYGTNWKHTLALFLVAGAAMLVSYLFWKAGTMLFRYHTRSSAYDELILKTARRHGVDPCLVKAVIWKESSFSPLQVGDAGEIGLMQVMPGLAARDWETRFRRRIPSPAVLFSPELNIEVGTWYLASAIRRWSAYKDNYALALCEYNAGITRAKAWKPEALDGDVRPRITISSTRVYVDAIMKQYEKYKKEWTVR